MKCVYYLANGARTHQPFPEPWSEEGRIPRNYFVESFWNFQDHWKFLKLSINLGRSNEHARNWRRFLSLRHFLWKRPRYDFQGEYRLICQNGPKWRQRSFNISSFSDICWQGAWGRDVLKLSAVVANQPFTTWHMDSFKGVQSSKRVLKMCWNIKVSKLKRSDTAEKWKGC